MVSYIMETATATLRIPEASTDEEAIKVASQHLRWYPWAKYVRVKRIDTAEIYTETSDAG